MSEAPPVPFDSFDYHDKAQLAAMYAWAGSARRLAQSCQEAGVDVKEGVLNKWRNQHGIPIANMAYRYRDTPHEQGEPESEVVRELLDYLKSRPVQPTGRPPRVSLSGRKYAKEIIGCDLHAPLHHEKAWELFLSVCEREQPEGVTLNGDTLDLAMISRFVRRPKAVRQLQADMDWVRDNIFARVNGVAPDATKTLVLGNHEAERYERYLWERCPELAELRCLSMESLMGLAEMGWRYEPDGYDLIPDVFLVDHGDRHTSALGGGSAMSARKEMIDTGLSGASGHTHHMGKFYRDDNAGYRVWTEGGCLCDRDKMREHRVTARKRGRKKEDWHLGFLIVYHEVEGEAFHVLDVPILENKRRTFCIVNGEEIAA